MDVIPTKMTFDTAIGTILAMGVLSFWSCITEHDYFYLPVAIILFMVALIIMYFRNKWNEKRKRGE